MQEAIMITAALGAIAMLVSIVFFFRGLYILIRGGSSFRQNRLEGKPARIAGLFLFGQLFVGFALYALFFEALELGMSDISIGRQITGNIIQAIIFTLFAVLGYVLAFRYAKARRA